jgi:hypothetical protein
LFSLSHNGGGRDNSRTLHEGENSKTIAWLTFVSYVRATFQLNIFVGNLEKRFSVSPTAHMVFSTMLTLALVGSTRPPGTERNPAVFLCPSSDILYRAEQGLTRYACHFIKIKDLFKAGSVNPNNYLKGESRCFTKKLAYPWPTCVRCFWWVTSSTRTTFYVFLSFFC